jgi:integrase
MESERMKASRKFRLFLNSLRVQPTTKKTMSYSIKTFWKFLEEFNWTLPLDSMTTAAEFEAWMDAKSMPATKIKSKMYLAKRFVKFNGAQESDIAIACDNSFTNESEHIRGSASGHVLSDYEELQLKAYTWKHNNERNRALMAILIDTGLNAVEIATAKKRDLSAETRSLFVSQGLRARFVVFSNQTKLKIAAAGIEGDESNTLFGLKVEEITTLVTAMAKDINPKIIDPFDSIKRTIATRALFRGVRIEIIAHMLGETVKSIMDSYTMARPADLRHVLDGVLWDSERPGNSIIDTVGAYIGT